MARMEKAVLAGGCFWCLEAVYNDLQGVAKVVSGYCGGKQEYPRYEEVCTGDTGHAEAVEILFDAEVLSFREILAVFFTIHDPTTENAQGNDVGTQYRSAIFAQDAAQERIAHEVMAELTPLFDRPIVTRIEKLSRFWPAEEYHQSYFARNAWQPYCQVVVAPKLAKFRAKFSALRKSAAS